MPRDLNANDMIARVRMAAFIPTSAAQAPDYTDAWILNELNDQQSTLFERSIVNADCGYWRQSYQFAITPGRARYPMPPRAAAGAIVKVDIAADANLNWVPLDEVKEANTRLFEQGPIGQVSAFVLRGDQITLLPTPDASAFYIRVTYPLRPGKMYSSQSGVIPTYPVRGLITAWNPTARVATVNSLPYDLFLPTPAVLTSQQIDIVRSSGWHERQVVGAVQSNNSVDTITMQTIDADGRTLDFGTVQVGDYIRVEEQTDWPSIPDDYARCLVDATAIKIRTQLRDFDSAKVLSGELDGDLLRFQSLLSPRNKETGGEDVVAPYDMYRSRGRLMVAKYP